MQGCGVHDPSEFVVAFDIKMQQALIDTTAFLDVLPGGISTLHSTCGEVAGYVAEEAEILNIGLRELFDKLILATNVL